MADMIASGQVRRSDLTRSVNRLQQGLDLTSGNLLRANELIHSFKQVVSDQSNEDRQTFDLREWLAATIDKLKPLMARHGLRVNVDCPQGITIDSYPGPLAQVISNLLAMNAAIHGYPNGQDGEFKVTASQTNGSHSVQIVFADAGAGIDPRIHERVLIQFFTTRRDQGNVGLGLHIVHNIVVATLAGKITLLSEPNTGTSVLIDIPTSTG